MVVLIGLSGDRGVFMVTLKLWQMNGNYGVRLKQSTTRGTSVQQLPVTEQLRDEGHALTSKGRVCRPCSQQDPVVTVSPYLLHAV